jgi:copper homeostasis protein (lipoprotein)
MIINRSFAFSLAVLVFSFQSVSFAKQMIASYEGTAPGADCSSVRTTIVLYKGCCSAMGTYDMTNVYVATKDGDKTFAAKGKWQYIKGTKKSKDEIVLQLNYDKPDRVENYLLVEGKYIRPLNKDLSEIDCPFDLTLKKKN